MYRCECGQIFDEPKIMQELMGEYSGVPAFDGFDVCPSCESDELTEIDLCPLAKEYKPVTEDYHDEVINWGDDFWTYVCESIQRRWDCSFKEAKEFLEYIVGRNI